MACATCVLIDGSPLIVGHDRNISDPRGAPCCAKKTGALACFLSCAAELVARSRGRSGMAAAATNGLGWETDRHFVPVWDGRPESFSHFVTEIKWAMSSTKKDERALLASKVIRKALQSTHSTMVQLMYKLDPDDFRTEESVTRLIKYLEESPLNRQPLPEALPAFLIREDKVHDDMLRALQRLLRERDLTFDEYDVSVPELKAFCGIGDGESLYFGPPEGTDAQDADEEQDLLQRLMEKGLMPLSALDVIRGWMVLEMSTSSEEERRIVKATTRNRLGYTEVRQALLAMYEDRGGKGGSRAFGANRAFWGEMDDDEQDDPTGYTDAAYVNYQYATDPADGDASGWWSDPSQWMYYQDPGYGAAGWTEWPSEEDEPNEPPNDEVYASLRTTRSRSASSRTSWPRTTATWRRRAGRSRRRRRTEDGMETSSSGSQSRHRPT